MRIVCLIVLLSIAGLPAAMAQKKVKLKQADQLRGGVTPEGEQFSRVLGNVIFVQNTTTIYCDSAHFYKKRNSLNAFGHVRITDGDSVVITSHRLEYDGNEKRAKLRDNVVFVKLAQATLYTDFLDYDRPKNEATYFNGVNSSIALTFSTAERATTISIQAWPLLKRMST